MSAHYIENSKVHMWQNQNNKLYKKFEFKDFKQAINFINQVAVIANNLNHHPEISNKYNVVELWLQTHKSGDITDKDHHFSKQIDMVTNQMEQKDERLPSVNEVKIYTDGGSRGNPGPSALGFVILDMEDKVLLARGEYLGITTNNQAEYQSLKAGLKHAIKMNAREVHVYMDSMLVINQMKGIFKVKNRDLWPIYESIKELTAKFSKINFSHVPRELNKLADAEVNKCLDSQSKN